MPPSPRYEVKASPGHGQPSLEIYRDPQATIQLLQQLLQKTRAGKKGRGRFVSVAGLVIPLVALLTWGVEAMIQADGNEQLVPLAETADSIMGSGSADGGQAATSWVRLGVFRNPDNARTMWLRLRRTQSDLLSDLPHKIRRVDREGRDTLHFLQVGPLNATETKMLCHDLADRNVDCVAVPQTMLGES